MPAARISVRKLRDVIRLSASGLSQRQIARALHIGLGSVNAYLNRSAEIGLSWAEAEALEETELKQRLYPAPTAAVEERYVVPNFGNIHQELKAKGVTRQLLWEEYLKAYPDNALKYSQFCHRYREWVAGLKRSMRQIHRAGEKLFVDYAGHTVPVVDRNTGELSRGADLRRGARGVELHLCRGDVDADAAGLDRLARARVRVLWRDVAGAPHSGSTFKFGGEPGACRYEPGHQPRLPPDLACHYYGAAVLPARAEKTEGQVSCFMTHPVLFVGLWTGIRRSPPPSLAVSGGTSRCRNWPGTCSTAVLRS